MNISCVIVAVSLSCRARVVMVSLPRDLDKYSLFIVWEVVSSGIRECPILVVWFVLIEFYDVVDFVG